MKDAIIKNCVASFYTDVEGFAYRKWLKFSISEPKGNSKLLVIMMNPGKSHPMLLHERLKNVTNNFNSILAKMLDNKTYNNPVDCFPDRTQLTVAKWMTGNEFSNFDEALVVNLSNYCSQNSKELYQKLRQQKNKKILHSIFETEEIKSIIDEHGQEIHDVLFAWGVNDVLDDSIAEVEKWITQNPSIFKHRFGHLKPNTQYKFYHPMKRGEIFTTDGWNPEKLKMKQI